MLLHVPLIAQESLDKVLKKYNHEGTLYKCHRASKLTAKQ
jgi:hypothetical protein